MGSAPFGPRRHLVYIIVRADRLEAIPRLHLEWPHAALIVDRRAGERRQKRQRVPVERRSGRDRRRPLTDPEDWLWREAGYRIAYRPASAN